MVIILQFSWVVFNDLILKRVNYLKVMQIMRIELKNFELLIGNGARQKAGLAPKTLLKI